MSRSTRMGLLRLGIAQGALKLILGMDTIGSPFRVLVQKAFDNMADVIQAWPEYGKPDKNTKWLFEAIERWRAMMHEAEPQFGIVVFSAVAMHSITVLFENLSDPYKKSLVDPLFQDLEEVYRFVRGGKIEVAAFEEADRIISMIDSLEK